MNRGLFAACVYPSGCVCLCLCLCLFVFVFVCVCDEREVEQERAPWSRAGSGG